MNTSKKPSDLPAFFTRKKFLLLVYSLFILLGAITPASKIPGFFARLNDKAIHGTEFFLLFWAAAYAFEGGFKRTRLIFAISYCAGMGAFTETAQFFVPSRSMSLADFFADAAGFCLAAILFSIFYREKK